MDSFILTALARSSFCGDSVLALTMLLQCNVNSVINDAQLAAAFAKRKAAQL